LYRKEEKKTPEHFFLQALFPALLNKAPDCSHSSGSKSEFCVRRDDLIALYYLISPQTFKIDYWLALCSQDGHEGSLTTLLLQVKITGK